LSAAPAAVVIAPVDPTSISAVLADAAPDEAAIISYDDLILDSELVDYYATFDHRAAGRAEATSLVDALGLADDPD
ncbi:substrate-binding domain-containing protein, partial [Schumannella luteola]